MVSACIQPGWISACAQLCVCVFRFFWSSDFLNASLDGVLIVFSGLALMAL